MRCPSSSCNGEGAHPSSCVQHHTAAGALQQWQSIGQQVDSNDRPQRPVDVFAAGRQCGRSQPHASTPACSCLLLLLLPSLPLLPLLGTNRPGAKPDLNPDSIQYSVVAPSAAPALGEPLAISVGRKGGAVPLFDTAGHR